MSWRAWTQHDIGRLIDLADAGVGDHDIARKLGRTPKAVTLRRQRLGVMARPGFSRTEASAILGVGYQTLNAWLLKGWIIGTRSGLHLDVGGTWRITTEALCAFLGDPRHARRWHIDRVQAGYWREIAAELRPEVLTLREAGRLLNVHAETVRTLEHEGRLPGLRVGTGVGYDWLILASEVAA